MQRVDLSEENRLKMKTFVEKEDRFERIKRFATKAKINNGIQSLDFIEDKSVRKKLQQSLESTTNTARRQS